MRGTSQRHELHDPDWLTVKDVAYNVQVGEWRVRKWVKEGRLKLNAEGFVTPEAYRKLMEASRVEISKPAPPPYIAPPRVYEPPNARQGVYFIRVHDFIKIGVAADVRARWSCPTDCPCEIAFLGYISIKGHWTIAGTRERELHRQFAGQRHRGEWFHVHPELEAYIAEHAQPWPEAK